LREARAALEEMMKRALEEEDRDADSHL
jgi:hypothetical protein